MLQDSAPLKSSGSQLKMMLKKTGRSLKGLEGVEKLDLLQAMTDQIKEKIELGKKMLLSLSELNKFLQFEGLSAGKDAKSAIQLLWELRQLQLARLAGYVAGKIEVEDSQWLVELPGHKVSDCFSWAADENTSPQSYVKCDGVSPQLPEEVTQEVTQDTVMVAAAVPGEASEAQGSANVPGSAESPERGGSKVQEDKDHLTAAGFCGDAVATPIKTSGGDLISMLKNTGHSLKGLAGAEKLDILNMITDQVKEKVQRQQKMPELKLTDLNAFLVVEGLSEGDDAKEAIELLLELRRRQLSRLGNYASLPHRLREASQQTPASDDADDASFKCALSLIPAEVVMDCFGDLNPQPSKCTTRKPSAQIHQAAGGSRKRLRDGTDDVDSLNVDEPVTSAPRLGKPMALTEPCTLGSLAPEGSESVASEMDTDSLFAGSSVEADLSPALKLLLAQHTSLSDTRLALAGLLSEAEQTAESQEESANFTSKQADACFEVNRILATKDIGEILVGGTLEEQRQQFQRIARLLHPDKGYSGADDTRANMALRLLLVARKKIM